MEWGLRMAILEVTGLERWYGRRKVVDGVSFTVDVGEVVGLLGPNGAGKTTSFRMTTGQVAPNGGRVIFNGVDVTNLPMYRRARLGMGYLAQETSIFRRLSVEQNIHAILESIPKHRTFGRAVTRLERIHLADKVLDQFGLLHLRKNNAARLSGGEKRRLEIARCLVADPLLILLDEPYTGIDPQTIEDIQKIVKDLRNQGIGILVTDHRVREILSITDRSYLIKSGKVVTHGSPQEIIRDPVAIQEYLGNSFSNEAFGGPAFGATSNFRQPTGVGADLIAQRGLFERFVSGDTQAGLEILSQMTLFAPLMIEYLDHPGLAHRHRAYELLCRFAGQPLDYDPGAVDGLRREKIRHLRDQMYRKAG